MLLLILGLLFIFIVVIIGVLIFAFIKNSDISDKESQITELNATMGELEARIKDQ